jgi:2-polyprenyl-6-methoxyphenol hydroxylase-like FAD-dependent oxidoreductase
LRVLIVGAGIAGLALARALRQRDTIAEVVERMTEWQPSGAGLYLPGNAGRALYELGVGPAVAARANPIGRADHARVKAEAEDSFSRFGTGSGYELPAVALCAVGV